MTNVVAGFGTGATFEGNGVGSHLGQFAESGNLLCDGPPDVIIPGHGSAGTGTRFRWRSLRTVR